MCLTIGRFCDFELSRQSLFLDFLRLGWGCVLESG